MGDFIKFKAIMKDYFKSTKKDIDYKEFINVEIILFMAQRLDSNIKAYDCWGILTQYVLSFLSDDILQSEGLRLYNLRKELHRYGNKAKWNNAVELYLKADKGIRLYDITEKGILSRSEVRLEVEREKYYLLWLDSIETFVKKDIDLAADEMVYYKSGNGVGTMRWAEGEYNNHSVYIHEELLYNYDEKLEKYREKKKLFLPERYDWKNLFDSVMKESWSERPTIKLISCKSNEADKVNYNGKIHIVGGLGAGKSNYKLAETYRLVTEQGAKVGIVENSVAAVIDTYNKLRELGIKAAPIIGNGNKPKHLHDFLSTRGRKIDNLEQWNDDQYNELSILSGSCTLAAISGDFNILPKDYPCSKLRDDKDKVKCCPLYSTCGHFEQYRQLINASVWIATPYSLLKSRIPKTIDPYGRTFYEAFHDLLDIIIVDEADGVQQHFDSMYLVQDNLIGDSYSIFNKFQGITTNVNKVALFNKEYKAFKWLLNFEHLSMVIPILSRMLTNSPNLHSYLKGKVITSYGIFNDLEYKLEKDERNKTFIEYLRQYVDYSNTYNINYDTINHGLNDLYGEITKLPNVGPIEEEVKKRIIKEFKKFGVVIPKNKKGRTFDEDLLYKQFELFIYIVQLDFYIKLLNTEYGYFKEKFDKHYEELDVFKGVSKDFRHFVTEPMTGTLFGYKFKYDIYELSSVRMDLFRYDGVGRSLLERWHCLKKDIGYRGPSVIMLSGTSFAPDSPHYNIGTIPTFILISNNKEKKIFQEFLPKFDDDGNIIKVSGVQGEKRIRAIRALTSRLIKDIRRELAYWKLVGENRKVLIVVNSYDNCKETIEILRNSKLTFRVLGKGESDNSVFFPKELIENFDELSEEADVFVAPLSIISRGYNILNNKNKSYFGSVFFMIRPYMIPDDLEAHFPVIHAYLPKLIEKLKMQKKSLGEAISEIRKFSFTILNKMSRNNFWETLDEDSRAILSWFTLVPIKQAIGRLQRSGTSCRVFYCDGAFAPKVIGGIDIKPQNSMLKAWEEILDKDSDNIIIQQLYGEYLNGLKLAIEAVEKSIEYDDEAVYDYEGE